MSHKKIIMYLLKFLIVRPNYKRIKKVRSLMTIFMPNSPKNIQKLYPKYILNDMYIFKVVIKLYYFGLTSLNKFLDYATNIHPYLLDI